MLNPAFSLDMILNGQNGVSKDLISGRVRDSFSVPIIVTVSRIVSSYLIVQTVSAFRKFKD